MTFEAIVNHPVFIAGASVAVVAIVNAVVRQIGKGAKTPARLSILERGQVEIRGSIEPLQLLPEQVAQINLQLAQGRELQRTLLATTGHQNEAITVLLEVTKGKKVNGNVDRALERMRVAQDGVDEYLVKTATGGK